MLGGFGGFRVAARRLTAVLAVLGFAWLVSLAGQAPPNEADPYGDANRKYGPTVAAWIAHQPDYYESTCDGTEGSRDHDLCQQWRMAGAAETQLVASTFGIAASVVAAIFTAWAALAAAQAAKAADAAVEITERTAKQELRAYVGAEISEISFQSDAKNLPFKFRLKITNNGATPAYQVQIFSHVDIHPVPLPDGFDLSKGRGGNNPSMAVVQPHSVTHGQSIASRMFDATELGAIREGRARRLYVYGRVAYVDAFGQPQTTDFCSSLVGDGSDWQAENSKEGNDAT